MPEARPNLLFVFTDQQSALAMGGPRQPWVQTPALQSLAARGVSFSRAYCAAPSAARRAPAC
jgi:arylsulfatase A-like enzyme